MSIQSLNTPYSGDEVNRTWLIEDVCKWLQVSEERVRDLMARESDPLPSCRLGERILRFDPVVLRDWLKRQHNITPSASALPPAHCAQGAGAHPIAPAPTGDAA